MAETTDPIATYQEVLHVRTYRPGTASQHVGLLPSERDLSVLFQAQTRQKAEVERVENQEDSLDIKRTRAKLIELAPKAGEPASGEYNLAFEKLRAYETQIMWELESWRTTLSRTTRLLARAVKLIDEPAPSGAVDSVRVFVLRDMEYEERLLAEDKTSTHDPATGKSRPDQVKRDLMLLRAVYQHELVGGQLVGGQMTGGTVKKIDPGKLHTTIGDVLVQRMWANTEMDPNLEEYFRGSGAATGGERKN